MEGVEILAEQGYPTKTIFSWKVFWICFLFMFCVCIALSLLFILVTGNLIPHLFEGILIGIASGTLLGTVIGILGGIPVEYQTEYKVTISDEVSINEFLEKYEIINQEGRIYTIRERNQEDLQ